MGRDGWFSVVRVPTCWAEAPAARREEMMLALENMAKY
jgi:hypothetical protein